MRRRAQFGFLAIALLGALIALPVFGQGQPAGPIQVKSGTHPQGQAAQGQKPFRVRVTLVTLPVAVSNSAGHPVLNLTQKDSRFSMMESRSRSPISIRAVTRSPSFSFWKPARASSRCSRKFARQELFSRRW